MSRRDGAIVAWHEVPGTAPSQACRPVGYGLIRAGVRTDSMIIGHEPFKKSISVFRLKKHGAHFDPKIPLGLAAPDHTVPYGTDLSMAISQALRARLRSVLSLRDALANISTASD